MEKERENEQGREERIRKITRLGPNISLQVRMYYPCSASREQRRKCSLTVICIEQKTIDVLHSAPTSESMLYFTALCLALDCVKFYPEVVITPKLSCGVYLSRVNTLQVNEGGQE